MDSQHCCRRQKTLASGMRVFTGRNSDSVVGDKAGLLTHCVLPFFFFFFNRGRLHTLKQTHSCKNESKPESK